MVNSQRRALFLGTLIWLVFLGFVLLDLKRSTMNLQPWDLWEIGYNPLTAILAWDKHALRYVVYWPIFVVAEVTGLHPDRVFTLVSALTSLGLIWALIKSDQLLSSEPGLPRALSYAVAVVAISFAIDGRIAPLLAAYALLLWAALAFEVRKTWTGWQAAALLTGGLLSSLSSGTLIASATFVALFALWLAVRHRSEVSTARVFATILAFFLLYGGWVVGGVVVNLDFFNNDMIAMLHHGLGRVALILGPVGLGVLCAGSLLGLAILLWMYRSQSARYFLLTLSVIPAAAGGLFGLTTLAIGIVPLLLMIRLEYWKELLPRPKSDRTNPAT